MTEVEIPNVEAWRVFALDDNGVLIAPFVRRYWSTAEGAAEHFYWDSPRQVGWCVTGDEDHEVPDRDCTCGLRGITDLGELLRAVEDRSFAESRKSILDESGVVGKVTLFGRLLPGVNMPVDDPVTTVRASEAQLTEVHLRPSFTERAQAVADRYAHYADVFTYRNGDWPAGVPSAGRRVRHSAEKAFISQVTSELPAGFGTAAFDPDLLLDLGRMVCRALWGGITVDDVYSVLFDSPARPTWRQVQVLHQAAVTRLCPECQFHGGDYQFARPIRQGEAWNRMLFGSRRTMFG